MLRGRGFLMAKADFKRPDFIYASILMGALVIFSMTTSPADADSTTIHAPCVDGTPTSAGLRACSAYIPQVLKQISTPGANYPVPAPSTSAGAIAGMMQTYAGCYYKGIDLDLSKSTMDNVCQGDNFGTICELVPSTLDHNASETATQAKSNNPQGPSCGTPMQISVQIANCSDVTDSETSLLTSLGTSTAQLEGMSSADAQALLAKAAIANPNVVASAASGKKVCITLHADGQNGSLERAYLKGTFVQALSFYTDQVMSQLKCNHTISVSGTGCQKFANQLAALGTTTQQNMAALQGMLQTQQNLGDIDACNTQTFNPVPTAGGLDPGALRQSAQHLCSARTSMEAAFSQLVMCDIISQAQTSYDVNTGDPGIQLKLVNAMNKDLDPVCRPVCKNPSSISSLQKCLQNCYDTQMPIYLKGKFQTFWPQPTPVTATGCVGGS
jgi:hypothetical protein